MSFSEVSMMGKFEELARAKFGQLTSADLDLLQSAVDGRETQPEELDAELLRWVCTDSGTKELVHPGGIRLRSTVIRGELDFSYLTLHIPLRLSSCDLPDGLHLSFAYSRTLDLEGSHVPSLRARRMTVQGDLSLNRVKTEGRVLLSGTNIDGNLECDEAQFLAGDEADSLTARRITVRGRVLLRNTTCRGHVSLYGATITGDLDCTDAHLSAAGDEIALSARRSRISGRVRLKGNFQARGGVSFEDAAVSGDLDCRGGSFSVGESTRRTALSVRRAQIGGNLFLSESFKAVGEILLVGARVGGNFNCRGASIARRARGDGGHLWASQSVLGNDVLLEDGFTSEGSVRFARSHISGNLNVENAKFTSPRGGGFFAPGAIVAGEFSWQQVAIARTASVNLVGAHIGTFSFSLNPNSWPAKGRLLIDGLVYDALGSAADDDNVMDTPGDWEAWKQWLEQQDPPDSHPYHPQPYQQLAKILRDSGREPDAKELLIAKEEVRFHNLIENSSGLRRFLLQSLRLLLRSSLAFGYRPFRPLVPIVAMLCIGAILFSWSASARLMIPTDQKIYSDFEQGKVLTGYQSFNGVVYSVECFVPLVDLHQKQFWLPDSGCRLGSALRWYLWLHIILGWVLTTLLVAGMTGLVRNVAS